MKYERSRIGTAKLLNSSQLRKPLTLAGNRALNRSRLIVRRQSGATAASGRLVHKQHAGIKGDRIGVSVVFGGAGVPLQFGNKRTKATRFLTRSLID